MFKISRYVFLMWIALAPRFLAATVYYVAANGNDAHNGLFPAYLGETNGPWRTLSRAAGAVQPGDRVEIRAGIYQATSSWSTDGTQANPITITSYPGEVPIIDGSNRTVPSDPNSPLIQIYGDWCRISNLEARNSGGVGIMVDGGAEHCTLTNIYVHDNRGSGITMKGWYGLVESCRAYHNTLINEYSALSGSWGAGISACRHPQYTTIRNCTAWDNWGEGISTFESYHITIEGCTSFNNVTNFYISDTQYCLFQRNLAYCTPGNTIQGYSTQNNIASGNEGHTPALSHNTFINNLSMGGERNFNSGALPDCLVANNTFVNASATAGPESACVYFFSGAQTNAVFQNNIILQEDGVNIAQFDNPTGITFGYNNWSKAPPSGCRGTGDVTGNPMLSKSGSTGAGSLSPGWFRILADSPAKDKATALSAVKEDFFGAPRGSAPDIGAHEFVGVGSSPVGLSLSAQTGAPSPGLGGTTDPAPGEYSYSVGSSVSVRSVPYADYRFSRWTGDVMTAAVFDPANTLIMDTGKSLSATFCVKCADINGDLQITPGDAQSVFDIYLGKIADPTWCQLENADVNGDGTRLSPKVTPADAQSIFLHYLGGGTIGADCSGTSRPEAQSAHSSDLAGVSLTINEAAFAAGQDVPVPVIIDSPSNIRAFGFDLAFPADCLTFVGVERTELTEDFDQLEAAVIPQEPSHREPGSVMRGGARVLRVGGYKTDSRRDSSAGVLVTLIFRATGHSPDRAPLTIIATYDDVQNASVNLGSGPARVRRPLPDGPIPPSPRRRS